MLRIPLTLRSARAAVALAALTTSVAGATLAAHPPAAHASPYLISMMMDDDRLLYRGDRTRDLALAQMKAIGVRYVRVTLLWSTVANNSRSHDPAHYPARNWDRYDKLVQHARGLGLGVYFDVTGPGPPWTHGRAPSAHTRTTWMPKAPEFYTFVRYVGRRYSGRFRNRLRQRLPRVAMWALWNEPNQGGWLSPQWLHGKPYSPILYRELYLSGRKALDDSGHRNDFIMAGETAPLGVARHTTTSGMYPKIFVRELFCMDPGNRQGCNAFDKFGPLRASAWAHHFYTKKLPPTRRDGPDSITIANISDLGTLLDSAAATTGHVAKGLPLMSTEFGYETNPPDPLNGIPLARQSQYINEGDYLAFINPRVGSQTQFLLFDAPPLRQFRRGSRKYWFTYQTGLLFANGRPKPAYAAYQLPFIANPAGTDPATGQRQVSVWGQLRFRPRPGPVGVFDLNDFVLIEWRPPSSKSWRRVGVPLPASNFYGDNPGGFFQGKVDVPGPGFVRAHWLAAAKPRNRASREVPVG